MDIPTSASELSDLQVTNVLQQSYTHLFVSSVHYVNQIVSQFEFFIQVFGQHWYQHREKVFLLIKVFCRNEQLIPQPHELVEDCLSHDEVLDQAKISIVISLEHLKFKIQVVGITFEPKKTPKSVLTFSKVHIIGTSCLVQGNFSVASHGWTRWLAGS